MSPRDKAALLYSRYRQPRSFEDDERYHRMTGYVIDTPTAYLMGRAVMRSAPEDAIRSPFVHFNNSIADAWFIWIFAGDIREMLHLAPYPLPFVGWSRRNGPIKWYRADAALERVIRYDNCRHFAGEHQTRGEGQEVWS